MGSFDFTCALSGLPVSSQPVVFLLLQETFIPGNKGSGAICNDSWWSFRTFPLRGQYIDCGEVEVPDSPAKNLWLKGFQQDLFEIGTGDNPCHDVAVTKDMSFDRLMRAILENRVFTTEKRSSDSDYNKEREDIPRFQTLSKLLGEGFLVDDVEEGHVRVRMSRYSQSPGTLKEAQDLLDPLFVTIEVPDPDSCLWKPEPMLRVFPKPGVLKWVRKKDLLRGSPSLVAFAMIREDVWNSHLEQTYSIGPKSFEDYKQLVGKIFIDLKTCKCRPEVLSSLLELFPIRGAPRYLSNHFKIMAETNLTPEEEIQFVQSVAEVLWVQWNLITPLTPSKYGGQETDFNRFENLYFEYSQICEMELETQEERGW